MQKERIGFAQAIINDPEIVFLDEPMSGLDPLGQLSICEADSKAPLPCLLVEHLQELHSQCGLARTPLTSDQHDD